ncbi:195_t:CDS:1, partial [Dentiscutata heterogama]
LDLSQTIEDKNSWCETLGSVIFESITEYAIIMNALFNYCSKKATSIFHVCKCCVPNSHTKELQL